MTTLSQEREERANSVFNYLGHFASDDEIRPGAQIGKYFIFVIQEGEIEFEMSVGISEMSLITVC